MSEPGLALDHLVVVAPTLAAGADYVGERLGVELAPGGSHPAMGTHNRLLRLGSSEYLEVIAVDPAGRRPAGARWFGLDDLDPDEKPHLATWVVRTHDIDTMSRAWYGSAGEVLPMARGELSWRIGVGVDGAPPMDGAQPMMIEWPAGQVHPASSLADAGCALTALRIAHPEGFAIAGRLDGHLDDPRVSLSDGPLRLHAEIATPSGRATL